MNTDEFLHALSTEPMRRLHGLAKGRIYHHFRMGRRRLIQAFLDLPVSEQLAVHTALRQSAKSPRGEPSSSLHAGGPDIRSTGKKRPSPMGDTKHAAQQVVSTTTLSDVLAGIGVPSPQPFQPDPWQIEAIAKLAESDVIVSVPTGSGKTYVALEAMRQAISSEQTVIYTSPLKALSNTKLTEFGQVFGADRVGILTGDRRDNPQAPILIMTTEILRNLLYDAASGEIDMRLDTLGLVILDESQYLADPERGVVWEETIIFCPTQARLLLLSASIGNPDEIAAWLTRIRPTPCHLIHHRNRSVPLRGCYLHPNGHLVPLLASRDITQGKGYSLHPEAKQLFSRYEEETIGRHDRR